MGDVITKPTTRRCALLAFAVAAALVLSACTSAQGRSEGNPAPFSADITGQLHAAASEAMAQSGSSGALVGVWAADGEWTAALGTTEIGGSTPMSSEMRFRIGTNTTAMTCTVLLRLVDAGTVALDEPVSTYLPRIVGVEGVTLGQLCQGTSGLGTYSSVLAGEFVHNPLRFWPTMELVSQGLAAPRTGAPGSVWGPSNTGIVLLGMALEQATGEEWAALYDEYIFHPLGLHDTSYPQKVRLATVAPALNSIRGRADIVSAATRPGLPRFGLVAIHPHGERAPSRASSLNDLLNTIGEPGCSPSSAWSS